MTDSNVPLAPPLQSVLIPRVRRQLDPELLETLTPRLIERPAQITQNPAFAGLPVAAPYQPSTAARSFLQQTFAPSAPRIDRNYQRNLTSLENKYNELEPFITSLPQPVQDALIQLDTERVSRGVSPMTREQTLRAGAAAATNQTTIPTPDRDPGFFGFLKNIGADLRDVITSLHRLPIGLAREVLDVTKFAEEFQEAQAAGESPLTAFLGAPGIRLIPGAYVARAITGGRPGELQQHPLLAGLDVFPVVNRLAAGTRVAKAAQQAHEAQVAALSKRIDRPLPIPAARPVREVLTRKLTPEGEVIPNVFGRFLQQQAETTPYGQRLASAFGARARESARDQGRLEARMKSFVLGLGSPVTEPEFLLNVVRPMFKRWEGVYPFLSTKPFLTPKRLREFQAQRAEFYTTLRTNPESLHPGVVADITNLTEAAGMYDVRRNALGRFDDEFYPVEVADKLQRGEQKIQQSSRLVALRNEYLNPSGNLTPADFLSVAQEVMQMRNTRLRLDLSRALEATMDAYSIETKTMKSARAQLHLQTGDWKQWIDETTAVLQDPNLVLRPRVSESEIIASLRATRPQDPQLAKLETALLSDNPALVTRYLDNIYKRKQPPLAPELRADIRSLSRRRKFDAQRGRTYQTMHARRVAAWERTRNAAVPARLGPLIIQRVRGIEPTPGAPIQPGELTRRLTEESELRLGHSLSPEQLGALARDVYDKVWTRIPGLDREFVEGFAKTVEREVSTKWREIRAELTPAQQPLHIHKVTPHRADEIFTGKIGPVPTDETHLRERALDLTPDEVRDVQVSITHQLGETIQRQYSEQYIQEVIARVGIHEAQLVEHFLPQARAAARINPSMSARGWLQKIIRDQYRRFDPELGFSWGGKRLQQYYDENAVYIPISTYNNLKQYAKEPSIFSTVMDPITKMFRYNVIGLSVSLIVNNFLSNGVAMTAERGLRPWLYFPKAWQWLKDPSKVPQELRAMFLQEQPHLEHLGFDALLGSRTTSAAAKAISPNRLRFAQGVNSATGFRESAFREAARTGKSRMDVLVSKSLQLQRMGDNIYRAMLYMDAMERGIKKPHTFTKAVSKEAMEAEAMELVRRTFTDYTAFTPIERNAIRSIIPFYSYMGHAARFVMRYPLNHPYRAQVVSRIAEIEKERLGALPGSFLSFFPIMSGRIFISLRPFEPFGDTANMASVAGWVSSMNPAIQVALRQIGVTRGEADLYPTTRFDPETGRMKAVRPNLLTDLVTGAVPRAGLLLSLAGMNPDYNELRARDPDAAVRSLAAQAGVPRLWRGFNVPEEIIRAEVGRVQSQQDVLNEALRTGDWTEALRYPNLRAYHDQIRQLSPEELEALQPAESEALAQVIERDLRRR